MTNDQSKQAVPAHPPSTASNSLRLQDSLISNQEILIATTTDGPTTDAFSLVLTATQIPHRIAHDLDPGYQFFVGANDAEKAKKELNDYLEENRNWPLLPPEADSFAPQFKAMALMLIGCLILFYNITGSWQDKSIWFLAGAGDSQAILQGQFYRLITSLTLHADQGHLLSNCLIGYFLLHFYLHYMGNGIGLGLLLVTAAFANLCNVLLHGPNHYFVGFSTAIFAIIGIFCTIGFIGKTKRYFSQIFMPVMAGLSLLAMLGSSGERTDLGAHLFGLAIGLLSGNVVLLPSFRTWRDSLLLQILLVAGSLSLIFFSWWLALTIRT